MSPRIAVLTIGTLVDPAVNPIVSGSSGLKYIFVVVTALGGIASAIGPPFLLKTHAPVLRLWVVKRAHLSDTEKGGSTLAGSQASEARGHRLGFFGAQYVKTFYAVNRERCVSLF